MGSAPRSSAGPPPEPRPTPDGRAVWLDVRLQPGARRAGVLGSWNGALRLAVTAPPEDGRANRAAAALLAELFGLRASEVALERGATSRSKVFRLALAPATARARLAELLGSP